MHDSSINLTASSGPAMVRSDPAHSARYVWYVIGLLTVVNIFNYIDRMALAILAPLIKADLRFSDSELGLLLGFAFAASYVLCGLPIARWADRGSRRTIISLALGIWSAMTALCGAAQSFWHLFVARVGVGAGEAGGLAPAQSLLCDYVPPLRRPGVFALHGCGLIAGAMLGMLLAGMLGEALGWRWTFVVLGLPGLVLAVIVWLTLRDPVRGHFERTLAPTPATSLGNIIGALWRCRTYRLLTLFMGLNGFVQYGLLQWWPSFYARVFGFDLSSVGLSLGLAFGTGSGLGVLLGGVVANRTARRDVRLPLLIGSGALVLTLPIAVASLCVTSAMSSLLFVAIAQLCWGLLAGPVMATLFSVTQPHMRATSGAITNITVSLLGMGLGPFCVGLLSDFLTPAFGPEALRYAMFAPLVLFPVLVLLVYAATKSLVHDLRAAGAHEARP